jgi:Squalene-hopene cyclase C-terminal domain/Prenyltransferase and squalene oxidase repeat
MTLAERIKSISIDTGLLVGLMLAVAGVYSVETRLPRRQAGKAKEGYEEKVEVEKGLSGTTEHRTYVLRTRKDKAKWIAQFGGSVETEGCVQDGLNWLVRHQADDGSWSSACLGPKASNPLSKCDEHGPCTVPGHPYVMAQTGLALLALQASGNYECNQEKYSSQVKRGLDWLIDHQQPDGALVGMPARQSKQYPHTYMYEHAMAAFALAEACAVRKAQGKPDEPRLKSAAKKAIEFIEENQHNDGGWRYTVNKQARSDCSVSGWAILALKSAREAEIPVSDDTVNEAHYFFKSCETSDGRTAYQAGNSAGSDAITAVGMLAHLLLLKDPQAPIVKTSASYLAGRAQTYRNNIRSGNAEFYTLYNATLAMYQAGGDNWVRWNDAVRDAVVQGQTKGSGCDRGSWDPRGTNHGDQGGRIYSTALATLMLEVYYRFTREGQATVLDDPPQ